MKPMTFPANTYICQQGQPGHTFHVILRGGCKVTVNDNEFETGERMVGTINADDYFGEVALLEGAQKRTANVITIERTVTMSFNRELFNEFLLEFRAQVSA